MATIDRFKDALQIGKIFTEGASMKLDAQLKYDYLAAVHTMDQLQDLATEFKDRNKKRDDFKAKLLNSCRNTLKNLVDDENGLKDLKNIDHAIKVLNDCRTELLKLDGAAHESHKLAKKIEDGVSAGR
ncbi:MAG: hypothetical protein IJ862_02060 [Selenomonadaceae bacterium]|nr:hypothetical protein [Selenomonadaceae bacterium]